MKCVKLNEIEVQPTKIVCVGRNYVEHIKELNNETPSEPVIFIKPNSSISNFIETSSVEDILYEAEICLLIKNGKIDAIGFGLDLTKRNLQSTLKSKGLPWERAKSFDKSAVFSDFVKCGSDLQSYQMELYINDELKQFANYELMIHKPEALIREIQSFMTLEDGDIIMTGTPKGVGAIHSGDKFMAKIYCHDSVIIQKSLIAK